MPTCFVVLRDHSTLVAIRQSANRGPGVRPYTRVAPAPYFCEHVRGLGVLIGLITVRA